MYLKCDEIINKINQSIKKLQLLFTAEVGESFNSTLSNNLGIINICRGNSTHTQLSIYRHIHHISILTISLHMYCVYLQIVKPPFSHNLTSSGTEFANSLLNVLLLGTSNSNVTIPKNHIHPERCVLKVIQFTVNFAQLIHAILNVALDVAPFMLHSLIGFVPSYSHLLLLQ